MCRLRAHQSSQDRARRINSLSGIQAAPVRSVRFRATPRRGSSTLSGLFQIVCPARRSRKVQWRVSLVDWEGGQSLLDKLPEFKRSSSTRCARLRIAMIAAIAAIAFASAAGAATPAPGSYHLNDAGKCIGPAPKTTFAPAAKCAAPAPPHCTAGNKVCGKICIPNAKVCHVSASNDFGAYGHYVGVKYVGNVP